MERDAKILGALESFDGGKGVNMASGDVEESVGCLRYYAGLADKTTGQTIDHFGKEKMAWTLKQPIGVCGQIIPWNYPRECEKSHADGSYDVGLEGRTSSCCRVHDCHEAF